jgi:hypothetical protein
MIAKEVSVKISRPTVQFVMYKTTQIPETA